jgi:hypothetical protein
VLFQNIPVENFLYLKSKQAAPVAGGGIRFSKNISETNKAKNTLQEM